MPMALGALQTQLLVDFLALPSHIPVLCLHRSTTSSSSTLLILLRLISHQDLSLLLSIGPCSFSLSLVLPILPTTKHIYTHMQNPFLLLVAIWNGHFREKLPLCNFPWFHATFPPTRLIFHCIHTYQTFPLNTSFSGWQAMPASVTAYLVL
jgi:hypothetical protein